MKYYVFSIFDIAADCYSRPFFAGSIGLAIRNFTDEVNRNAPENPMYGHPQDFQLFHVAIFDDAVGEFFHDGRPVRVSVASDVQVKP